ncbi:Solute carrier family 40 member 3, chloroplastic [Glycine max]|nr:Solute carrier family 40 member 3, chloroplastic [Glycine max]
MAIATPTLSLHFAKFPIRQTDSSSPIRHRSPSGRRLNLYYPHLRVGTDVHLDHVATDGDGDEGQGRGVVEPHCPVPFVKLNTDILEAESLNLLAEATVVLSEEEQHAPFQLLRLTRLVYTLLNCKCSGAALKFCLAFCHCPDSSKPFASCCDGFLHQSGYNCWWSLGWQTYGPFSKNAAAQLLSAAMIIHAHSVQPTSFSTLLLRPWFVVLVSAWAIERLCVVALGVANERDWIVLWLLSTVPSTGKPVFKGLEAIKLGWKEYLGQPVLLASLAWVFLYFNIVLMPGSLLTAFLTQRGLHPSIIGGFSGMCALMGVAATFVPSTLVKQFGILKAGAVGLVFQALLLSMAVAVYWSGTISHQSPLLTFLFLIDTCHNVVGAQILQTGIPSSKANLIGMTEIAVASLVESIMLGVAIIANDLSHLDV